MVEKALPKPHEAYIAEIRNILGPDMPRRDLFERYRPKQEWFYRKEQELGEIHDTMHHVRVLILQELLSRMLEKLTGLHFDHDAMRISAITHDTRRKTDSREPDHGANAAEFVLMQFSGAITDESLELASYINRWHDTTEGKVTSLTGQPVRQELRIIKDADALDLVRLPTVLDTWESKQQIVKPKLLRFDASRELLKIPAETLYGVSDIYHKRYGYDHVESVLDAGAITGLINPY